MVASPDLLEPQLERLRREARRIQGGAAELAGGGRQEVFDLKPRNLRELGGPVRWLQFNTQYNLIIVTFRVEDAARNVMRTAASLNISGSEPETATLILGRKEPIVGFSIGLKSSASTSRRLYHLSLALLPEPEQLLAQLVDDLTRH